MNQSEKITAQQLVQELALLLRDEWIADIVQTQEGMQVTFLDGQRFSICAYAVDAEQSVS